MSASGVIKVTALKHCPQVPASRPSSTSTYTTYATGQPPSGVHASARRYAPGHWEISVSFTARTPVTSARSSYTILLQLQDGERLLWKSDQNIARNTRVTEVFRFPLRAGIHTGTVRLTTNRAHATPPTPDEIWVENFAFLFLNPGVPASLATSGAIVGRFAVTIPSNR